MLRSLILSFVFALNFIGKPVLGELAIVYGDVKLTASENCTGNLELTTADNTVTAARRVNNGTWKPVDKRYSDRIVHNSPSSLILTNLTIKDSGHFEFFCGNKHVVPANNLKVLVAYNTTVTEGDTAVIYCYSLTDKQVKWFKERGKIRVRDAFSQEVFSKEDKTSPGRFPLILEKVRLEDQGVYICDAPMAFKLNVNPRSDQTTSPPPHHPNTTQSHEGNEMRPCEIIIWVLVPVVCVLVIVVIVLAILLYLEKKKGRKSNVSPEPERSVNGDGTELDDLLDHTKRNGSHANNHGSH